MDPMWIISSDVSHFFRKSWGEHHEESIFEVHHGVFSSQTQWGQGLISILNSGLNSRSEIVRGKKQQCFEGAGLGPCAKGYDVWWCLMVFGGEICASASRMQMAQFVVQAWSKCRHERAEPNLCGTASFQSFWYTWSIFCGHSKTLPTDPWSISQTPNQQFMFRNSCNIWGWTGMSGVCDFRGMLGFP